MRREISSGSRNCFSMELSCKVKMERGRGPPDEEFCLFSFLGLLKKTRAFLAVVCLPSKGKSKGEFFFFGRLLSREQNAFGKHHPRCWHLPLLFFQNSVSWLTTKRPCPTQTCFVLKKTKKKLTLHKRTSAVTRGSPFWWKKNHTVCGGANGDILQECYMRLDFFVPPTRFDGLEREAGCIWVNFQVHRQQPGFNIHQHWSWCLFGEHCVHRIFFMPWVRCLWLPSITKQEKVHDKAGWQAVCHHVLLPSWKEQPFIQRAIFCIPRTPTPGTHHGTIHCDAVWHHKLLHTWQRLSKCELCGPHLWKTETELSWKTAFCDLLLTDSVLFPCQIGHLLSDKKAGPEKVDPTSGWVWHCFASDMWADGALWHIVWDKTFWEWHCPSNFVIQCELTSRLVSWFWGNVTEARRPHPNDFMLADQRGIST